jgi:uncharacterized protein DUF6900
MARMRSAAERDAILRTPPAPPPAGRSTEKLLPAGTSVRVTKLVNFRTDCAGRGWAEYRHGGYVYEAQRLTGGWVLTTFYRRADEGPAVSPVLAAIAKEHLGLETLETRKSDALDFSDQAVWSIRAALEAAYEAGKAVRS